MAAGVGAESERWCIVLVVVERDGNLVLVVEPTRVTVPCPRCGELSRRQHSRYDRHPLDLPWRGKTVRMRVHSRRWFCDTPDGSEFELDFEVSPLITSQACRPRAGQ